MRIERRTSGQRWGQILLGAICSAGLSAGLISHATMGRASEASVFSASDIYRNTASSVVLIFGFAESGAGSSGTGSILTQDGLILTNNHVISDSSTSRLFPNLVVYFKPIPISGDNRKDLTVPFLVDVVARDETLDLALLRVKDAPAGLRPVEVADSDEVEIGESVAAIGHPGGGGLWTLTTGTISSKRRDQDRDIFQTDTAINPGNSGGPLFDGHSRLVGINTFVRRVNDQGLPLEGLNYSLRSSLALNWVNQQGVARVSAVPRQRVSTPLSVIAPRPSEVEPQAPTRPQAPIKPRAAAESPKPAPAPAEELAEPAPRVGIEPELAPEPRADLRQRADRSPPPPIEPEAREFKGPNGEPMYGVPNPTIDLHEALVHARKGYRQLIERADESIEEMDRLLDDYDNF